MYQKSDPFRAFQASPQASRLLNDSKALEELLSAPETAHLMELLSSQSGASLQKAAQAAADGAPEDLMQLLEQLTKSREGARAVEELRKKAEQ